MPEELCNLSGLMIPKNIIKWGHKIGWSKVLLQRESGEKQHESKWIIEKNTQSPLQNGSNVEAFNKID